MSIPDNYGVLFLQGGAPSISMVARHDEKQVADYYRVGPNALSPKQNATACPRSPRARIKCSPTFPTVRSLISRTPIMFISVNNTITGLNSTPAQHQGQDLVCDMSSCILSEPVDVSKYLDLRRRPEEHQSRGDSRHHHPRGFDHRKLFRSRR